MPTEQRPCEWCGKPFERRRQWARFCSTKCRKNGHRFGAECVPRARAADPIRVAYADPPYPGLAAKFDHAALLRELSTFDAWALSTSEDALITIGALAVSIEPRTVHVASWNRGARGNTHAVRPVSAWEPVLYCGGRLSAPGQAPPPDALAYRAAARRSDPNRCTGTKPARFAFWLFELLGAQPGDVFVDVFPGSGGMGRAWSVLERGGTRSEMEASAEQLDALIVEDDANASGLEPGRITWAPSSWLTPSE